MSKREREIRKWAKRNGWRFDGWTGGTHVRLIHKATGAVVIASGTPRGFRWERHLERDARRAIREASGK